MTTETQPEIVYLSPRKFMAGCAAAAAALLLIGWFHPFPSWVVALEVMLTILSLFAFGSAKYQIDKNALTYGAALVIISTFWWSWWPDSALRSAFTAGDWGEVGRFVFHYGFTLHGLDEIFHADTMLFILGLTFFVCVIAQTRLLETVSFKVLRGNKGRVLPTVAVLTGLVAFASGILDGVSMIGLMIRTLVIILFLAKAADDDVIFAVIVSTVITTVCGMWLAYGEPPNLIMKSNLHPLLNDAFFLRYCAPAAIGSYLVVYWNLRNRLKGKDIEIHDMDVLDLHTDDVRFLQAEKHGEVLTPIEFVEDHADLLGDKVNPILQRLHHGEPLGRALFLEGVPEKTRKELLGKFVAEELADPLDAHYMHTNSEGGDGRDQTLPKIRQALDTISHRRIRSQRMGALAFIPFVGLLIWHAVDHSMPLFWSSFAGFAVALAGIYAIPKMRALALHEAKHEYMEYLFLFPLFLSITLLQKSGFFSVISQVLHSGIETLGVANVAYAQFWGATLLSAILDNNVVADFAGRAIQGMETSVVHLFAMAQIAGYATGGCWTHIGSAQSVVAYAFIRKEVNERYTPFQWIRAMTPIILQIAAWMTLVVYVEGLLLKLLH